MLPNVKEAHVWFVKKTGYEIPYPLYRDFICSVLKEYSVLFLQGNVINLENRLGNIVLVKRYRHKLKMNVDFGATRKNMRENQYTEQELEEKKHVVYRTNDWYWRVKWNRYGFMDAIYSFKLVKQIANQINKVER